MVWDLLTLKGLAGGGSAHPLPSVNEVAERAYRTRIWVMNKTSSKTKRVLAPIRMYSIVYYGVSDEVMEVGSKSQASRPFPRSIHNPNARTRAISDEEFSSGNVRIRNRKISKPPLCCLFCDVQTWFYEYKKNCIRICAMHLNLTTRSFSCHGWERMLRHFRSPHREFPPRLTQLHYHYPLSDELQYLLCTLPTSFYQSSHQPWRIPKPQQL